MIIQFLRALKCFMENPSGAVFANDHVSNLVVESSSGGAGATRWLLLLSQLRVNDLSARLGSECSSGGSSGSSGASATSACAFIGCDTETSLSLFSPMTFF